MRPLTGSVILDLLHAEVTAEEREILQHPLVGGIILFKRHYESPKQIAELCREIRAVRKAPLLITVDQEGGLVQRFIDGFTRLPSMEKIGVLYESAPQLALRLAETAGWLMASEILSVGVDLSFAPVLDLNKGHNKVVGSRAFHSRSETVVPLARTFIRGMRLSGMCSTGKHFPGHGEVNADSHDEIPVDPREWEAVYHNDMRPFRELLHEDLDAVMPAHIVFPAIDEKPVCFSRHWLKDILRDQLDFKGTLFSDDLNMKGASSIIDYAGRAEAAFEAGCDFILICNNRTGAIQILDRLPQTDFLKEKPLKLQGNFSFTMAELKKTREWQERHSFLLKEIPNDNP